MSLTRYRWPWTRALAVLEELRPILRGLYERPTVIAPPPTLDPFVCALATGLEGTSERWLGASGRANRNGTALELMTQVPLTRVRVVVFCDLERVNIHGIFRGTDLLTTALGSCPVVTFDAWPVGVKLSVQVTRT